MCIGTRTGFRILYGYSTCTSTVPVLGTARYVHTTGLTESHRTVQVHRTQYCTSNLGTGVPVHVRVTQVVQWVVLLYWALYW